MQECISRNLTIKKHNKDTDAGTLPVGNFNVITSLVELFEDKDEAEYHRLLKQFGLRA